MLFTRYCICKDFMTVLKIYYQHLLDSTGNKQFYVLFVS